MSENKNWTLCPEANLVYGMHSGLALLMDVHACRAFRSPPCAALRH